MSTDTITALVERMLRPLQEALNDPDGHIEGLKALNAYTASTEALDIPEAAKRQLTETVRRQRRTVENGWRGMVGAELKRQAKPLGLLIDVRVAKRRPRKPKAAPEAPKPEEARATPQQASSEVEGQAPDDGKKGSGVFGLGGRRTG